LDECDASKTTNSTNRQELQFIPITTYTGTLLSLQQTLSYNMKGYYRKAPTFAFGDLPCTWMLVTVETHQAKCRVLARLARNGRQHTGQ
jgi:hypothetical protein